MKVPVHSGGPDQVAAAMTTSGTEPRQHLPRGQRQQVDLVALSQDLRVDRARRPEQRPSHGQEVAEPAFQAPGRRA